MLGAFSTAKAAAEEKALLRLVTRTAMPGYTGDFDHFAVDLKGNRVFLAAEDQKKVEVFDLHTGARVESLGGFGHPLVLHFLPKSNQLIVTDIGFPEGAPGAVHLVDLKTSQIAKTCALPPGVDHGAYNPVDNCYYAESGPEKKGGEGHLVNVIDVASFKKIGDIAVPGESHEGMIVDQAGKTLYLNLTGTDEVGVIDLASRKLVARWPLPDAHNAHAIALDESNRRLFTVTRKPARFIVFDLDSGKPVSNLPCVGVNSDISRDVARGRIYITGTDTVSVFEQRGPDQYVHLAEVPSAYRAKSSVYVPELNRLYVAASGKNKPGTELALLVFEAQ
ncbi:MAG: hypothetical protein JWM88_2918 [Verrucomicrobia bacterium]|nr:hypothetical protein [Verrucomicrobiota bacterium]